MNETAAGRSLVSAVKYPDNPQQARRLDVTLRQNIDDQIAQAEQRVEELRAAKSRMEASHILDMRIDDIQSAMRW